jgi:hypothetical protein
MFKAAQYNNMQQIKSMYICTMPKFWQISIKVTHQSYYNYRVISSLIIEINLLRLTSLSMSASVESSTVAVVVPVVSNVMSSHSILAGAATSGGYAFTTTTRSTGKTIPHWCATLMAVRMLSPDKQETVSILTYFQNSFKMRGSQSWGSTRWKKYIPLVLKCHNVEKVITIL